MKTYSIAEINDLEHGIPISRFQGTIKKVFEQKSGEGQYGPWFLQNLIVEDGQQEITVTWTGDDPFDAGVEGQTYSFETGYDKKEKPVGIVRDIRKKGDKTYEGIKVDNRSKIKRMDTEQGTTPVMAKSDPEWPEAHIPRVIEPESPPARQNIDSGVQDARKHLMKAANLYALCVRCANSKVIANEIPEVHRTNEQFQSTLASLWIEASSRRSTDGKTWWSYIDLMPDKPL